MPGLGDVVVDVAYGGNFYVLVPASALGLRLTEDAPSRVSVAAGPLLAAASSQLSVQHPEKPGISAITHVMVYDVEPDGDLDARVQVVVPPDVLDRSPCGTGTTARVAALIASGRLPVGGSITHTSLTGQTFTGRALAHVEVGAHRGALVANTGSGFIVGDGNIYIDERDPLAHGYSVT